VEDAINTATGDPLVSTNPNFATKFDTIDLNISVGDDPVPYWLRPNYTSANVYTSGTCPSSFGNAYGVAYIGPNANPSNDYLPVIPGSSNNYLIKENVEVENAEDFTPDEIIPVGLTQGEYRFKVKLTVNAIPICPAGPDDPTTNFANSRGSVEIYLYKRIYTPSAINPWVLSNNENNFGTPVPPATASPYKIGQLVVNTFYDEFTGITTYGPTQELTTSFTIEADTSISPDIYEYAVGVKLIGIYQGGFGSLGQTVTIYGNDANYAYSIPPALPEEPFEPPITNDYLYYTGVEEYSLISPGETSAIPRNTQDALLGTSYTGSNSTNGGTIALGDIDVDVELSAFNEQVVPGLYYTFTSPSVSTFSGRVLDINVGGNPNIITLQLSSPFSGTAGPLAGGNISFETALQTSPPTIGVLYANTEEGTEIKRFYTDSAFTQKWVPPVPNKFYNFQTSKNYNPGGVTFGLVGSPLRYTEYPYYSAYFNEDGEVVDRVAPEPNVQTAWTGQNNNNNANISEANYSYNVLYEQL
jgi:hypothetical protein